MKLHVKLFVLFEESGHHYKTIWNRLMEDNFNFEIIQVSQNAKVDPFTCDIVLYTIPFIEPIVRENASIQMQYFTTLACLLIPKNLRFSRVSSAVPTYC